MKKGSKFVKAFAFASVLALVVCMVIGCSNASDSGSGNGGSGGGGSGSTNLKAKLPASVGEDPFNGKTYQYSSAIYKAEFKDGVLTITKSDAPYYTYHYSYDATNKRLYCIFRSITKDGKTYDDVKAYVTKNDALLTSPLVGYTKDYVRDNAAALIVCYTQLYSFSYEQSDSSLTLTPYFNGFTAGSDIFPNVSFSSNSSSKIENHVYNELAAFGDTNCVTVRIPGTSSVDGYVTKVDGNKFTCAKIDRNGASYFFTVEVDVTSVTGSAATAKLKLTSIDDTLKTACGQSAGAEFTGLSFSACAMYPAWTRIINN